MGKDVCHMKRIFTERARLVLYLEAKDLNRLTEHARGEGKMVVEWARETLLGELTTGTVELAGVTARKVGKPAERRASSKPAKAARTCVHGTKEGYNCWQCGGKAIIT